MDLEISVGDKVEIGGNWYTVKLIREEQVRTIRAGTLSVYKLYFKEPHAPIYWHEVTNWKKETN